MVLQYAAPGAVWPLYSSRLERLGLSPNDVAACCSTQAAATLVAPLLAGHIADRWVHAERFLAACAFLAAIDLWVLAGLRTPTSIYVASLVFWLLTWPIMMLGVAVSFTHLEWPERDYGPVRLWGTVGWALAGWLLAGWFADPHWLTPLTGWLRPGQPQAEPSDSFRLGALFDLALAAYALTLPRTPPQRSGPRGAAPLAALRLLAGGPFFVYLVCYVATSVTLSFTSQGTPLLLTRLGLHDRWLALTLTLGQLTEVLSLALLPMFLLRLGLRNTMALGLGTWVVTQTLLAIGQPLGLAIGSLVFNGFLIGGFFVAGQVFVNRTAGPGLRASAQGLLTLFNGLGMLLGHFLVGWLREGQGGELSGVFRLGAVLSASVLTLFLAGFHDRPRKAPACPPKPAA